jgi:hypothetical protein
VLLSVYLASLLTIIPVSVTLADNYFNESFPQVFSDTLAPVFVSLGVPLHVRNHALGNNPCYPYDACVETHLGDDLDILVWEQVCRPSASNVRFCIPCAKCLACPACRA